MDACLDAQGLTTVSQLPTASSTATGCAGLSPRSERPSQGAWGVAGWTVQVCVGAPRCLQDDEIASWHISQNMSHRKATSDCSLLNHSPVEWRLFISGSDHDKWNCPWTCIYKCSRRRSFHLPGVNVRSAVDRPYGSCTFGDTTLRLCSNAKVIVFPHPRQHSVLSLFLFWPF